MPSRRKSIGRGDEASGPVMSAQASAAMRRGARVDEERRYGNPAHGKYARKLGGEYGASVQDEQL
ncbi:hypothetical protein URH17368_2115 [Alicyclobacillus hesperidum URH17-3-68]|uniref:Uncharacterized protein n=1 Tax=Alicyclobacillus hesperidum TaxID=89784 RepID=A0A1H2RW54_9BACL|nr:hypothetical protein [Alicyclobacillus hesperidum]EJY55375.1 hypothetical protein URH17368_2115 [Alicyclobacillus hesperidum URH17-3-68]GLV13443.1 hypothetical protein Heshes_11270 [Alicyclobacillus hesperidum]SDW23525.1 hypothetical protein SAMN04489725_103165 [Alicyclobacillus hesperidum]